MDSRRFASAAIVFAIAIGMLVSPASGDKPVKPPTPGDEPAYQYTLVDLLGFPDNGYQSQGQFITDRDGSGTVLIAGDSRTYPDPEGPAVFHPVLWHVDSAGSFPVDEPIDLGIPDFARGVDVEGMTSTGIIVARTSWSALQISEDKWLFPSYVDFSGVYVELPGVVSRNNTARGINDAGLIVGAYEDYAVPGDPDSLRTYGGLWQLSPDDGSISGPISLGDFYPWEINNFGVMVAYYRGWPAIGWFEGETLMVKELDTSLDFWGANIATLNDCPIGDARLTVLGTSRCDSTGDFSAPDRGFVWRPYDAADPTTILGTLGGGISVPLGVNTQGDVVGWSDTKKQGQQAFLFRDGTMSNLNDLAETGTRTLQFALDINENGDIVGFMRIPRPVSEQRGFLLRPIEP